METPRNNNPKRGRKPKAISNKKNEPDIPKESIPDTKIVQMDLSQLLQSFSLDPSVQAEIAKEARKQLDSEDAILMVKNILSEYFSTFILLGYDVNGQRTVIKLTKTDRDEDSIIELIRYVMLQILSE